MAEEKNDIQAMLQNQACDYMAKKLRGEGEVVVRDPARLVEMLADMTATGYPGILVPAEHGGEGGNLVEACIVIEEVATGEPTLGLMLLHHLACTLALVMWADEERKALFLPPLASLERTGAVALTEPEAGSDFSSIKARLERREGELLLEGNKCFVTNTGEGMESYVLGFFKEDSGLACVLVPSSAPGFHLAHHYRFAGWEGMPNHALVLQDCTVSRDHLIAERLEGERFERWNDAASLFVSAAATGMAKCCMEEAIRYCSERTQFGKKLFEHQSIRFRLADMAVLTTTMRTGLHLAASRMDEGLSRHADVCMLKLFATSKLEEVASSAMEMAAGYGYTLDSRLSWLYRDAKGMQLLWGTREMMRLEIATSLGMLNDAMPG
jgi:alkylation response protein AidB-like acyl-CoA dehydrogenase